MPSIRPFTCSIDGKHSREENVAWHAKHRYDFLTITDHNCVTVLEQDGTYPFIPGVEITARREATRVEYHLITSGVRAMLIPHLHNPQETIDAINADGGLCFIAHPCWHDHTLDDLLPLQGRNSVGLARYS